MKIFFKKSGKNLFILVSAVVTLLLAVAAFIFLEDVKIESEWLSSVNGGSKVSVSDIVLARVYESGFFNDSEPFKEEIKAKIASEIAAGKIAQEETVSKSKKEEATANAGAIEVADGVYADHSAKVLAVLEARMEKMRESGFSKEALTAFQKYLDLAAEKTNNTK